MGENDNAEIDAWLSEIAEADMELVEAAGYDIDAWLSEIAEADTLTIEVDMESGTMPTGDPEAEGEAKVEVPEVEDTAKPRSSSITYTIVFDDEEQQSTWHAFGRWLKIHGHGETLADRLISYIDDNIEL